MRTPLFLACLLQIELPVYSSVEVMRQRLLTAITYGEGFMLR